MQASENHMSKHFGLDAAVFPGIDVAVECSSSINQKRLLFVAVLGASNYTYAEATWTQNLWDWIHSHVWAFEFFGGTSQLVIPDNLKSGVKTPCYYEPELNLTYGDLAAHYGVGILSARPYRPRDKVKAAIGVQIVQRWVLATLRKRQFFSLAELNEAILELVHKLNERPFRKLAGSRADCIRVSIALRCSRCLCSRSCMRSGRRRG
jgi:transposase